ncbi:MAG: PBP1A family penicillin-binding protein [Ignavibacteriaceae bacterium]|nr:PBP1A family penicillin-binding protein [Ignavibacteriaceae bacterium]
MKLFYFVVCSFLLLTLSVLAQDLPPIKIDFASQVISSDGKIVGYIGEKSRVDLRSTGNVSKYVLWSLFATEDRDFYNHNGVSYKGLVRGIFKTITGSTQGGSTITMQLARNLFLSSEKTISRKVKEIEIAKLLESKFTKDQILLMYLNTVYFGHGVYGIWAAAQEYYGKTPDKLSITESAAIVGLLQGPGAYDPVKHPDKMLSRRNEVLHNLVETGRISDKEFNSIRKSPLNLRMNDHIGKYFIEHVRKEALDILKPYGKSLNVDELKITTTLNYEIQKAAENSVKAQWNNFPASMKESQLGLISVENGTGKIRAMIGGNPTADFRGLNRADQIKRQPGSSFKPFLYGTLLQNGTTLAAPLLDAPIVVDSGKYNEWRPSNSENTYTGKYLTMETAIQHSINLCAAYAITHLTVPDSVVAFARKLGIQSQIPPYPSIALGTGEVSPLEMAASYSVFASEGLYAKPYSIIKIEDKNGRVYYNGNEQTNTVLDSSTAYLMTQALEKVIDGGTAVSVRKFYRGFGAGKTGTTQNSTDAWFVGYNKSLTTAIWIGYDDPRRKLSGGFQFGGSACGPIWGRMMSSISRNAVGFSSNSYSRPPEIKDIELCLDSGELAVEKCIHKSIFPVNTSKLPPECSLHSVNAKRFDIHYGW